MLAALLSKKFSSVIALSVKKNITFCFHVGSDPIRNNITCMPALILVCSETFNKYLHGYFSSRQLLDLFLLKSVAWIQRGEHLRSASEFEMGGIIPLSKPQCHLGIVLTVSTPMEKSIEKLE